MKGRDIREAFKGEDYQILLVANKFQTGFDQPLLCGMYVDRRLAGIQAVQTLSRLNRAHPGKDTTYILDFVNSADDVLTAFKTYYETAELEAVTDPNLVYDLRAKLDAAGSYDDFEVDRVAEVELNPKAKQGDLVAAIEPGRRPSAQALQGGAGAAAWRRRSSTTRTAAKDAKDELDALILFKNDIGAFLRIYTFLSQMFDYGNTAIEKRFIFYRRLLPLLEFGREREGIDLSKVQLTHHSLKGQGKQALRLGEGEAPKLAPLTEAGSGSVQDKEKARLRGDHREGERPLRGRAHRRRPARLRQQRDQGEDAGERGARDAGDEQHQGAVRQLADALDRTHERDHGRARRAHDDEQAGAGERAGAGRAEGRAARAGPAL